MRENFGILPDGSQASLYTISCAGITARITDLGATLVQLWVPDSHGRCADVVLGYDDAEGYLTGTSFLGTTVGRNANRVKGSSFCLAGKTVCLTPNEGPNNLHSGPDCYNTRLWTVEDHTSVSVTLRLNSPNGDQGFPGNAVIRVTYSLDPAKGLHIRYEASADQDTVFNLTNHSYFNLTGHENTEGVMEHSLTLPARFFNPDDAENIPTGELRPTAGTPMDFRSPKKLSRDIGEDYVPLKLQGGYDHNFEVFCNPCAILDAPDGSRSMAVYTDCPGIQLYTGNFLLEQGKGGIRYGKRTGIALETQFWPDSVNHPEWPQPFTKAGDIFRSETVYRFSF